MSFSFVRRRPAMVATAAAAAGAGAVAYYKYKAVMAESRWPPKGTQPMGPEELGPLGFTKHFKSGEGLILHSNFWPAENPKAIVVLVHGHGTYLGFEFLRSNGADRPRVYEGSWVERLNKEGFSCCGIDLQSMGRSQSASGLQVCFERFDSLVEDLIAFTGKMKALGGEAFDWEQRPCYVYGSSLGGCLATHLAIKNPDFHKGVILTSPMLSLENAAKEGLNAYLKPLLDLANTYVPNLPIVATPKNDKDADLQVDFDTNALCYRQKTRVRQAAEYINACNFVMSRVGDVEYPFLIFHSNDDPFTDPQGSVDFFDRAGSKDKSLRLVDGMWHVLMHEQGNEVLLDELVDWLHSREEFAPAAAAPRA